MGKTTLAVRQKSHRPGEHADTACLHPSMQIE